MNCGRRPIMDPQLWSDGLRQADCRASSLCVPAVVGLFSADIQCRERRLHCVLPLEPEGAGQEGVAVPDMPAAGEARFVTGNIMRHVVVMAGTGAIGLIAVFAVDLLNLFYISLLGQRPIAAAIGFAGVVGFFETSVLIGLTIGVGAVVAHSIGAGEAPRRTAHRRQRPGADGADRTGRRTRYRGLARRRSWTRSAPAARRGAWPRVS